MCHYLRLLHYLIINFVSLYQANPQPFNISSFPKPIMQQSNQFKVLNILTSRKELIDLAKAWFAISLAFGIMYTGFENLFKAEFVVVFLLSAFTVGTGFLLHELAHKLVAQRYGCFAEFRSFDQMLVFSIVMSFMGLVFAAPGAVFISGPVGRRRNGIISAAGPLTNLILAGIFLGCSILVGKNVLFLYGLSINSWLAVFNMIPFMNFDGAKIFAWSKFAYFGILIAGFAFMLIQPFI